MNITTHGGTTDASDKQQSVVTIGSKDLLALAATFEQWGKEWRNAADEALARKARDTFQYSDGRSVSYVLAAIEVQKLAASANSAI